MKTLRYLRENGINFLEGLVIGYVHQNEEVCQGDFVRDFPMARTQASYLFRICVKKDWLLLDENFNVKAVGACKFYKLTDLGKKHGKNIPPDHD